MKSIYKARAIDVDVLYENNTTLRILSLATWQDTHPLPFPSWPSCPALYRLKVPNVARNDVKDNNVKHSNFKILKSSKTKPLQLFFAPLWLFTIQ